MSNPAKVSAPAVTGHQQSQASKVSNKDASKGSAHSTGRAPETTSFRDVMNKIAKEVGDGQKTMEAAMNVKKTQVMENNELLAFQTKIYRYTHVLELTGKVVDKTTQSFKYTLQSQQ